VDGIALDLKEGKKEIVLTTSQTEGKIAFVRGKKGLASIHKRRGKGRFQEGHITGEFTVSHHIKDLGALIGQEKRREGRRSIAYNGRVSYDHRSKKRSTPFEKERRGTTLTR